MTHTIKEAIKEKIALCRYRITILPSGFSHTPEVAELVKQLKFTINCIDTSLHEIEQSILDIEAAEITYDRTILKTYMCIQMRNANIRFKDFQLLQLQIFDIISQFRKP